MTPDAAPLGSTPVTWRRAALRIGEELASVGPDGYYRMSPAEWLAWALATIAAARPVVSPGRPWELDDA